MPVATILWQGGIPGKIKLIDQTLLPNQFKYITCETVEELWRAIKRLSVRGAPALGIAGAMGAVLGIQHSRAETFKAFAAELDKVIKYLGSSRPTAVNLFWGLERIRSVAHRNSDKPVPQIKRLLLMEAKRVFEEDRAICRAIGHNGAMLLPQKVTVLTHCNAGGLATSDYGTALAVLFAAHEQGKKVKAFADETRPLLQGARLTTWELMKAGIDVTLICDNMAAQVMKEGKVDCVIVGADRIAANGDTANKIGTYGLSLLARAHKIPFYVAAPASTFDLTLHSGDEIPIEHRDPEEITICFGSRIAPKGVKAYNPAFDVTPARYITGIITERGVIMRPTAAKIRRIIGETPGG